MLNYEVFTIKPTTIVFMQDVYYFYIWSISKNIEEFFKITYLKASDQFI